jgi:hypothetical protein
LFVFLIIKEEPTSEESPTKREKSSSQLNSFQLAKQFDELSLKSENNAIISQTKLAKVE